MVHLYLHLVSFTSHFISFIVTSLIIHWWSSFKHHGDARLCMIAVKMAREILPGNLSMSRERPTPLKLWPTRTSPPSHGQGGMPWKQSEVDGGQLSGPNRAAWNWPHNRPCHVLWLCGQRPWAVWRACTNTMHPHGLKQNGVSLHHSSSSPSILMLWWFCPSFSVIFTDSYKNRGI